MRGPRQRKPNDIRVLAHHGECDKCRSLGCNEEKSKWQKHAESDNIREKSDSDDGRGTLECSEVSKGTFNAIINCGLYTMRVDIKVPLCAENGKCCISDKASALLPDPEKAPTIRNRAQNGIEAPASRRMAAACASLARCPDQKLPCLFKSLPQLSQGQVSSIGTPVRDKQRSARIVVFKCMPRLIDTGP